MRRLTAARPPGLAVAALACALTVLAGLAWSGTGPRPVAGWRVPAPAVARLTVLADRVAQANGDASPEWMTAVLTTHAKALTSATPGDTVSGAGEARVYLVTMRGHFIAYESSPPSGAALPTGRYLSVVVDATTFRVLDLGLSPAPPPVSPANLGPVTYLTDRGR
jgi:hypothetical protein